MKVRVVSRYSRYSSPKKLINRVSSSVPNAFSTDLSGCWGTLTSYAVVEESPKDRSKQDKTYVVLEDHLCPNCPVEEASVRRMSKPPAVECQGTLKVLERCTYA